MTKTSHLDGLAKLAEESFQEECFKKFRSNPKEERELRELSEVDLITCVPGHWLAVSMIGRFGLRMATEIYFCSNAAKFLDQSTSGGLQSSTEVIESMRSFCGAVSEGIQSSLSQVGLELGRTPVVVMRGFDRIFLAI